MPGYTSRSFGSGRSGVPVDEYMPGDLDCFADDVVVDFPSVERAVDRIRRAFLREERGELVQITVRLSAQQAREGALVPVRVSLRATCRGCGGRGEVHSGSCERCSGSGVERRRHRVQLSIPAGVLDGSRIAFAVDPASGTPVRVELSVLVG